jgi:hypothetical protein
MLIIRSILMPRLRMSGAIPPLRHMPPWFTEEDAFNACNLFLMYYFSISSAVAIVFFYLMTPTGIQKVSVSGLGDLCWELHCQC